jgi:hypothetical protein
MSHFIYFDEPDDYEPEDDSNENSGMSSMYKQMLRDGIPTDDMGRIYLSDGMVLCPDGTVKEQ